MCAIGILVCGLFAIQAGRSSNRIGNKSALLLTAVLSLSFILPAISWLHEHLNIDREYCSAAQNLPDMRGSHLASNDMTALYFAYYKDAKFYGIPKAARRTWNDNSASFTLIITS